MISRSLLRFVSAKKEDLTQKNGTNLTNNASEAAVA